MAIGSSSPRPPRTPGSRPSSMCNFKATWVRPGSYSGSALSLQGQPTFSPYDCQGTFDLDQVDSLALTTTSDGVQVTGTFTDGSAVYNLTGTASGLTTSTQNI